MFFRRRSNRDAKGEGTEPTFSLEYSGCRVIQTRNIGGVNHDVQQVAAVGRELHRQRHRYFHAGTFHRLRLVLRDVLVVAVSLAAAPQVRWSNRVDEKKKASFFSYDSICNLHELFARHLGPRGLAHMITSGGIVPLFTSIKIESAAPSNFVFPMEEPLILGAVTINFPDFKLDSIRIDQRRDGSRLQRHGAIAGNAATGSFRVRTRLLTPKPINRGPVSYSVAEVVLFIARKISNPRPSINAREIREATRRR